MKGNLLKTHYGIDANEAAPMGRYQSFKKDNEKFFFVPVDNMEDEELAELEQLANHLKNSGDRYVSTFMHTKDNSRILKLENQQLCLLTCRNYQFRTLNRIGRKLAKFHFRGRTISFSVKKTSRIGQWKSLWEKRLDQMEKVWNSMLFQQPESEFDRMFVESFSYYMAIGENAIQFLVDTELDDEPKTIDSGTICHSRFTANTWGEDSIRSPFDWVFDHCSRDLSEWTRERYLHQFRTYQHEVKSFFTDYQTVEPLSSFAWRLFYSRLLFPLHYVECIEEYYSTNSEQQRRMLIDRLEKYLVQTNEHERFLKEIFELVEVPVRKYQIPKIDWL
ncbi:spore coat putative kinase YutH [Bacillus benzoevorans]|uniref:Spore coat protein YutH n=1 Tax=Bacillus benzoevorans TaxID=1456 RepID=A0A7X0HQD6_9BACI|nr:spore coat protein YutH [Bacillus benzoevorans]MBB6445012.1 spore coat protein YutH [Bacillus benzoevorans]